MIATLLRAALVLSLVLAGPAGAEESPRVTVSLSPESLAPGETAVLRYTVLVPTWMPEPVTFPPLDRPELRITLPERGTVPTSERIDGATWSGVTRAYRLTPLAPGNYALDAAPLEVTYADPEGQAPITRTVTPVAPLLSVTLPAAAEGLEPYVAAGAITLTQQLEVVMAGQTAANADATSDGGDDARDAQELPSVLSPGDSLTRTVTATVEDGAVMLLPTLIPDGAPAGLGVYPETPRVTERDDGGERVERVTYVVEGGVVGMLPAIELRWLNLDDGEIAESRLPGVAIEAEGPTPAGREASRLMPWLIPLAGLAALLLLAWTLHRRWPAWREAQHRRSERSGRAARRRLRRAVAARDLAATRTAWREVDARFPNLVESRRAAVEATLLELGRLRFGPSEGNADAAWRRLSSDLPGRRDLAGRQTATPLPPLNPR